MTSSSFRCPSSSTRRGRRDNARGGARKGGDGLRPSDLVNRRLCAQRISATAFTRPADVVAWLGAVQAQDFLGALWAVGLRLTDAREPSCLTSVSGDEPTSAIPSSSSRKRYGEGLTCRSAR